MGWISRNMVLLLALVSFAHPNVVGYFSFDDSGEACKGYSGYCDLSQDLGVAPEIINGSASIVTDSPGSLPQRSVNFPALGAAGDFLELPAFAHVDSNRQPSFSDAIRNDVNPEAFSLSVWVNPSEWNSNEGRVQTIAWKDDAFELYVEYDQGSFLFCRFFRVRLVFRIYFAGGSRTITEDIIENPGCVPDGYDPYILVCQNVPPVGSGPQNCPYNSIQVGQWSHVVITADGSNLKMYIDNQERESEGMPSGILLNSRPNTPIYIGNTPPGNGRDSFGGTIDEFTLYDHALTSEERNTLYNGRNPGTVFDTGLSISSFSQNSVDPEAPPPGIFGGDSRPLYSLRATGNTVISNSAPLGSPLEYVWIGGLGEECETLFEISTDSAIDETASLTNAAPFNLGQGRLDFCVGNAYLALEEHCWIQVLPTLPTISSEFTPEVDGFVGDLLPISVSIDGTPLPLVQWQQNANTNDTNNGTANNGTRRSYHISREGSHFMRRNAFKRGNTTSLWENIPGATSEVYTINVTQDLDGYSFRALVINSLGETTESSETRLTVLQGGNPNNTDGGDGGGDGGFNRGDGGDDDPVPIAVGASIGALLIICCGCLALLILFACCVILMALVIFGAAGVRRAASGEVKLKKPDARLIAYGSFLEPQQTISSSQQDTLNDLERLLVEQSDSLPFAIVNVCDSADLDKVCNCLLFVMDSNGLGYSLISSQIEMESRIAVSEGTLFRANSAATKMFTRYTRIIGHKYLWDCFSQMIHKMNSAVLSQETKVDESIGSEDSSMHTFEMMSAIEIGPSKSFGGESTTNFGDDAINILQLQLTAQKILKIILANKSTLHRDIVCLLRDVHDGVIAREDFSDLAVFRAIGGFFFLRYVCPALLTPQPLGLCSVDAPPLHPSTQRNLVLLGKVMQNLANNTLPGAKEEYMAPLNDFVTKNVNRLEEFYAELTEDAQKMHPQERFVEEATVRENALYSLLQHIERCVGKLENVDEETMTAIQEIISS